MSLAMTRSEREAFLAALHVGVISISESGRGPLTLGRLPGDLGNVDPGEGDDFGPNTSNPQTDDPGSALDGFGGSGLSIADAHRDDEEDDDDSDDDDSN